MVMKNIIFYDELLLFPLPGFDYLSIKWMSIR